MSSPAGALHDRLCAVHEKLARACDCVLEKTQRLHALRHRLVALRSSSSVAHQRTATLEPAASAVDEHAAPPIDAHPSVLPPRSRARSPMTREAAARAVAAFTSRWARVAPAMRARVLGGVTPSASCTAIRSFDVDTLRALSGLATFFSSAVNAMAAWGSQLAALEQRLATCARRIREVLTSDFAKDLRRRRALCQMLPRATIANADSVPLLVASILRAAAEHRAAANRRRRARLSELNVNLARARLQTNRSAPSAT